MTFSIGIVQMGNEIKIEFIPHNSKEEFADWVKEAGGDEVVLAVDPYRACKEDDHRHVIAAMALCPSTDGIGQSLQHLAQQMFDLGREFEQSEQRTKEYAQK